MNMTKLSVNINKVALIRNSRGEDLPDLVQVAKDCEAFGADGITVHPRPDERHIRYDDIPKLKAVNTTEFNIEGFPNQRFIDMILLEKPTQCTLVPDPPGVLTSNTGWDTIENASFLTDIISSFKTAGVRVSLFLNPEIKMAEAAAKIGADRIEFYTGLYAKKYHQNKEAAVAAHTETAHVCNSLGLGINAGHDLNLKNLKYYKDQVPNLLEVSIGHALISDALYFGLENSIQMYQRQLSEKIQFS